MNPRYQFGAWVCYWATHRPKNVRLLRKAPSRIRHRFRVRIALKRIDAEKRP